MNLDEITTTDQLHACSICGEEVTRPTWVGDDDWWLEGWKFAGKHQHEGESK